MSTRLTSYTNDGLTFEVVDEGPLDGVPVVLLHGFPQTATSWARLVPHLHERGYRTIAPTQRGYSPDARPQGRYAHRISALVGDTVALVDTIGAGAVHLVGHDWGAIVAWATATRHPAAVQSLTSVSVPHPMAFVRSMLASLQAFRSYYMGVFQLPWLPEALLSQRKALRRALASTGMDDDQIAAVVDGVVDRGAIRGGVNWYRAMPFVNPLEMRRPVTVPTTHVWSTGDRFLSRKGADITERYVTGPYRLEVLDASHWVPEERPAELAAIIAERVDAST